MSINRRYFLKTLASGLVAATAPNLFLPKLIKPAWKVPCTPPLTDEAVGECAMLFTYHVIQAGSGYRLKQVESLANFPPGPPFVARHYVLRENNWFKGEEVKTISI